MSRSRLRVALCTDGVFPQALGGMQRHSRLLAEHLARFPEIELHVLHPHEGSIFDARLGIHEVNIVPMDTERFYLGELYRYSERIASALDALQPDIVFAQGFCLWKGMERFSDRAIVHPHGLEMFQGLTWKDKAIGLPFRLLLRWVVRRSAVTVSLGGKLTSVLEQLTKGSPSQVVVLPNAAELPAVPPSYPMDVEPINLLFVGRFAFNKGIDVLVEVARNLDARADAPRFRFVLAGDGPERARWEREGLPSTVEIAGRVDDARLEELYSACHALVLPTRFEGMPTVVLEAMARSRPAFVSDVGAAAELVDAGNGYLLPPGDADALEKALLRFAALSNRERASLGAAGRQRAAEHFTWEKVSGRFVDLFRSVAARKASA